MLIGGRGFAIWSLAGQRRPCSAPCASHSQAFMAQDVGFRLHGSSFSVQGLGNEDGPRYHPLCGWLNSLAIIVASTSSLWILLQHTPVTGIPALLSSRCVWTWNSSFFCCCPASSAIKEFQGPCSMVLSLALIPLLASTELTAQPDKVETTSCASARLETSTLNSKQPGVRATDCSAMCLATVGR